MSSEETRRILDMIESGRISASEGARLLDSTRPASAAQDKSCPYCAEQIPESSTICPECRSDIGIPPVQAAGGFQRLSSLGKFLALYTLLVGGIGLASPLYHGVNIGPWLFSLHSMAGLLLSVMSLLTGILLLKDNAAGWTLGILWSAMQIITVVVHGHVINRQIFHLGMNMHANGQGLGINLVGIILLILFIKAKSSVTEQGGSTG